MAISPMNGSKRSPLSSSSKSKLKQKKNIWEHKKNLVKKRLMGLTDKKKIEKATNDRRSCGGVSTSAMERAQEIQANLSPHCPSFLKNLLKSHVTGGFWLGLPRKFCLAHLPKHDDTVVLVDENEQQYDTKYLVDKNGLSGGWRGFSMAHKLLEEDVLVFQLIGPSKFKVHIVRARTSTEVNNAARTTEVSAARTSTEVKAARSLLNLHAEPIGPELTTSRKIMSVKMEENQPEEHPEITEKVRKKYLKPVAVDYNQKKNTRKSISTGEPARDESSDDINNFGSQIPNGITFSESILNFKDVKSFDNFKIQVDGLILDSKIPTHLRTKYYELCLSQNMFLHENLIPGLNSNLSAGMISETINIADAIRAAKHGTAANHLESWDKTLKAFEDLGMAVGFLRARINKLLSLSREYQANIESKRNERAEAEDEMRALKVKLSNVKTSIIKIDAEIDALKAKNEELGFVFTEAAGAPW
ncbi:hypothetical protein DH2020_023884 [Rehmannia glutinosa]|uniref:TF-B3 domain-containing protein n=1 Tax=Rehmannia glutinosa TaxID=99300 RepID=A0ABR0WA98_REHGL